MIYTWNLEKKESAKPSPKNDRLQNRNEEKANTITHGVAALLILIFNPFLILKSYESAGILGVVGTSIFSTSIFLMFLASCLYHAMAKNSRQKEVLHILDHIFIFVAIAGTYTPIALIVVRGWQGIVILAIQWSAVLWGILYKSLSSRKTPKATLVIYLIMGWVAVIFFYSLITKANIWLLFFILLGGIFYSIGSIFYRKKNIQYMHMVWHLFVFFGAVSHYIALMFFLIR